MVAHPTELTETCPPAVSRAQSATAGRCGVLRRGAAAALSAALVAAVVVIGCDRPAAPPPPVDDDRPTSKAAAADYWPDSAATNPATAPSTRPTPGYAKGRVRAADGKPLDLKDRRAVVTVVGSSANGVERPVTDTVKPDGTYAIKLDPGPYLWPTGMMEFRFNSYQYRLPLTPANAEATEQPFGESRAGIVRDFRWALSGPREGMVNQPDSPVAWIGGTVYLKYTIEKEPNRSTRPPPAGTVAVLVATPRGPLADGSAGKPLTFERAFDESRSLLRSPYLHDVPLGVYVVTGFERFPDGRTGPYVFFQRDGKWAESVEMTFMPDVPAAAVKPASLTFARKFD